MKRFLIECVSLRNPFMERNKHLVIRIFASMIKSKNLVYLGAKMSLECMSRLVGVE